MMLDGENSVQIVDRTKRRTGERKGRKASYRLWCFSELLRYALGNKRKEEEAQSAVDKKNLKHQGAVRRKVDSLQYIVEAHGQSHSEGAG